MKMSSLGIRNNNPFNIRYTGDSWQGLKHDESRKTGFCVFENMRYGVRAGLKLLKNAYILKGFDTVEKIIPRFAPPSENNVHRYIMFVVEDCPLDFDTKICVDSLSFYWLCRKMAKYESLYDLSYHDFISIKEEFNI